MSNFRKANSVRFLLPCCFLVDEFRRISPAQKKHDVGHRSCYRCYTMLWYRVISCCIMLYHVISCYIILMLSYIMLYPGKSNEKLWVVSAIKSLDLGEAIASLVPKGRREAIDWVSPRPARWLVVGAIWRTWKDDERWWMALEEFIKLMASNQKDDD